MTPEYFRSRRRKIGLASLALACLVAGLWFRGQAIQDSIWFGFNAEQSSWSPEVRKTVTRGNSLDMLSSCANDGLVWGRYTSGDGNISWLPGWKTYPAHLNDFLDPFEPLGLGLEPDAKVYHWGLLGIEAGKYRMLRSDSYSFWRVSHWSLALPLTLISARLLLPVQGRAKHFLTTEKTDPRTMSHVGFFENMATGGWGTDSADCLCGNGGMGSRLPYQ